MLRLAIRITLLVILLAGVAAGQGYRGSRPLWAVIAVGVLVIGLMFARLTSRLRGGRPPEALVWDTAKRAGRRAGRQVVRVVAGLRRARRRGRVRSVELAALEAAVDDDAFSPESVRTIAESLFRLVQLAWDARDSGRLAGLVGPELLARYEQRLAHVPRHERAEVVGDDVRVEYVGFTTSQRGHGARLVVLIEAAVCTYREDRRGRRTEDDTRLLCQYWTLGLREGRWTVLTIEERAEGKHHLAEPIGTPSSPRQ
jgi:predicted lipid-binding transport protein (Tim44 family)